MLDSKLVDWKVYKEGKATCHKVNGEVSEAKNPYNEGSKEWYSWNRGWNSVEGV